MESASLALLSWGHVWPERDGCPILGTQPLAIWFYRRAPICPVTRVRTYRKGHGASALPSEENSLADYLKAK